MKKRNIKKLPIYLRLLPHIFSKIPVFPGYSKFECIVHSIYAGKHWHEIIKIQGIELEVLLDDLIGRTMYLKQSWEKDGTIIAEMLLQEGNVVFDVGANIGYFSLTFALNVCKTGTVFAFEPVNATYNLLKNNLSRNPKLSPVIKVFKQALSYTEGTSEMKVPSTLEIGNLNLGASHIVASPTNHRGRSKSELSAEEKVECTTGDIIWIKHNKPEVTLVKLDIEGHEYHALKGMEIMLASSKSISLLIEVRNDFLSSAGSSVEEIFTYLRKLKMNCYDFDSRTRKFKLNNTPRDGELLVFSRRKLEDFVNER